MKLSRYVFVLLTFCCGCYAQGSKAPVTSAELQYFRFVLMNVGSIDHSPDAIQSFEALVAKQIGLNSQESAVIHSAGQTLNALLKTLRSSSQSITAGKTTLTPTDGAALAALTAQREQMIVSLTNQILNSVRSSVANTLRAQGNILATAPSAAKGAN